MMTIEQIDELATLQPGWDSYNAPAIDPACIEEAKRWAVALPLSGGHAVPLGDGGVQLEWHHHGWDLEVCFRANGEAVTWWLERNRLEHIGAYCAALVELLHEEGIL